MLETSPATARRSPAPKAAGTTRSSRGMSSIGVCSVPQETQSEWTPGTRAVKRASVPELPAKPPLVMMPLFVTPPPAPPPPGASAQTKASSANGESSKPSVSEVCPRLKWTAQGPEGPGLVFPNRSRATSSRELSTPAMQRFKPLPRAPHAGACTGAGATCTVTSPGTGRPMSEMLAS